MNTHVRQLAPDFLDYVDPEDLRDAIDAVAMLRARVIRVGLFGTLLFRPDPTDSFTAEDQASHAKILRAEVDRISALCNALQNGTEVPDIDPQIVQWLQSIATRRPEKLARVMHIASLSRDVVAALEGPVEVFGKTINNHMLTTRAGFGVLIAELCEAFWLEVNQNQAKVLETAKHTASTLARRLIRLEHIGKHVRLVSLNASVEAARAGDLGKGLMVIAQEFKELAEEIQTLASDAQSDMDAIS